MTQTRAGLSPTPAKLTALMAGVALATLTTTAIAEEKGKPTFEAGVVSVLQNVNDQGSATGQTHTRANYRGDVTVEMPVGKVGGANVTAFGHVRFGQGTGVALTPTYTATPNSITFETGAGPDDSFAILAQGYLNFAWGGDEKKDRVDFTLGKLDVFGFFDQNAVAGDEAAQFLNNVFVHNPLLDSGGDIAADAYGFAPGLRLAYTGMGSGSQWGVSVGLLGSGNGANFSGGFRGPLGIAQVEWSPLRDGEPSGNYRVYAWTNAHTVGVDGNEERHTGVGLSADQKVGDFNLFGRVGVRTEGDGMFNDALTVGFEVAGSAWGREGDTLGVAVGSLKTSAAWRDASLAATSGAYTASGQERIAEIYYRIRLNEHIEVSPDFQLIQRPGGNPNADDVRVIGVRASVGF
jgi:high affinity Mn2+ porin